MMKVNSIVWALILTGLVGCAESKPNKTGTKEEDRREEAVRDESSNVITTENWGTFSGEEIKHQVMREIFVTDTLPLYKDELIRCGIAENSWEMASFMDNMQEYFDTGEIEPTSELTIRLAERTKLAKLQLNATVKLQDIKVTEDSEYTLAITFKEHLTRSNYVIVYEEESLPQLTRLSSDEKTTE